LILFNYSHHQNTPNQNNNITANMQTGLVLASFAATAMAGSNLMAMPAVKRHVEARQGLDIPLPTSGACATAALELITNFPTPAPEIVSDIVANPQSDPCDFTTPASLSKEYASYSSDLLQWVSSNEAKLSTAIKECPQLTEYAAAIPVCTNGVSGLPSALTPGASTATPGASKTDSVSESKTGSEAPATSTPGGDSGAARQGGAAALALAVAGLAIAL
jgi:hypothetical protein